MCTNITLKSKNKVVAARTNEFGYVMEANIVSFPKGMHFNGVASNKDKGLKWTNKYGYLGITADDLVGSEFTVDGMNEEGLAVQLLYFPGYAKYEKPTDIDHSVTYITFSNFVLGNFKTVAEVKEGLKNIHIISEIARDGKEEPCHFQINDKLGNAIVVEVENEIVHIYDNPNGVMTNSPNLPFQLQNLSNYMNINCKQIVEAQFGHETRKAFGFGSGALGLPGDFTPPSRFIRATFLSTNAIYDDSNIVDIAFRILNNFDLVDGAVCSESSEEFIKKNSAKLIHKSNLISDVALYSIVKDLTDFEFYYKDHFNNTIRKINGKSIDLNEGASRVSIPIYNSFAPKYIDVTTNMSKLQ